MSSQPSETSGGEAFGERVARQIKQMDDPDASAAPSPESPSTISSQGTLKVPAPAFEKFIRELAEKLQIDLRLSCHREEGPLACEYEVEGSPGQVQKFRQVLQKKVEEYRKKLARRRQSSDEPPRKQKKDLGGNRAAC